MVLEWNGWGLPGIVGIPVAGCAMYMLGPHGLQIVVGGVFSVVTLALLARVFLAHRPKDWPPMPIFPPRITVTAQMRSFPVAMKPFSFANPFSPRREIGERPPHSRPVLLRQ